MTSVSALPFTKTCCHDSIKSTEVQLLPHTTTSTPTSAAGEKSAQNEHGDKTLKSESATCEESEERGMLSRDREESEERDMVSRDREDGEERDMVSRDREESEESDRLSRDGDISRDSEDVTETFYMKLLAAVRVWVSSSAIDISTGLPQETGEERSVHLPPVHSVSGHQLQWNIFRRQMMSSLPRVCSDFKLNLQQSQDKVVQLASHFQ